MKIAYLLAVPLIACAQVSNAAVATTQGTIALMRDSTLLQPDGRLQGVFLLQLSVPLSNGCNWVWISPTDKATQGVALSAKAMGAQVTLWYDNTIVAPWGETDICGAVNIDLN